MYMVLAIVYPLCKILSQWTVQVLILLSQDSGLQVDRPEFNDANGVSRVQQIDWYAVSVSTGSKVQVIMEILMDMEHTVAELLQD